MFIKMVTYFPRGNIATPLLLINIFFPVWTLHVSCWAARRLGKKYWSALLANSTKYCINLIAVNETSIIGQLLNKHARA